MRELRKSRNKKLAGVAGGFAEYFGVDPTLMRALWLIAAFPMPPVILAYLILAAVMPGAQASESTGPDPIGPEPEEPPVQARPRRFRQLTKSLSDRWLAGVCGGIGEYLDLDPVLIRALFLAAFFAAGFGLMLYLILAILMPRPQCEYR